MGTVSLHADAWGNLSHVVTVERTDAFEPCIHMLHRICGHQPRALFPALASIAFQGVVQVLNRMSLNMDACCDAIEALEDLGLLQWPQHRRVDAIHNTAKHLFRSGSTSGQRHARINRMANCSCRERRSAWHDKRLMHGECKQCRHERVALHTVGLAYTVMPHIN